MKQSAHLSWTRHAFSCSNLIIITMTTVLMDAIHTEFIDSYIRITFLYSGLVSRFGKWLSVAFGLSRSDHNRDSDSLVSVNLRAICVEQHHPKVHFVAVKRNKKFQGHFKTSNHLKVLSSIPDQKLCWGGNARFFTWGHHLPCPLQQPACFKTNYLPYLQANKMFIFNNAERIIWDNMTGIEWIGIELPRRSMGSDRKTKELYMSSGSSCP